MTVKLTKSVVSRLAPGVAFDSELPGFAVKVLPSGRRVFIFQYRVGGRGGRMRRITVGEFRDPPLLDTNTVDGARRKAAEHRAAALRGEDPFAALATPAHFKGVDPRTVSELATEYLTRWAIRHADGGDAHKAMLERDVLPRIGTLRIEEVTRRDLVRIIDAVTDRGSPVMANRVHGVIQRMFNFALARGLLDSSPVVQIERNQEKPRARFLSAVEIPLFWNALDVVPMEQNLKSLLRFMLMTARRRSEALFLHRRELDGNLWTLPAARIKTKQRDLLIPLPDKALALLPESDDYFFVSGRTGMPYAPHSVHNACRGLFLERKGRETKPVLAAMPRITPHDLRRTAATHMRAIGIGREHVKMVLGHAEGDVLGRHYDLYEGLNEKRSALEHWTSHLFELIYGGERPNGQ